jgi:hypothetical protein
MGLDTGGFVISRSPVQARRVAPYGLSGLGNRHGPGPEIEICFLNAATAGSVNGTSATFRDDTDHILQVVRRGTLDHLLLRPGHVVRKGPKLPWRSRSRSPVRAASGCRPILWFATGSLPRSLQSESPAPREAEAAGRSAANVATDRRPG